MIASARTVLAGKGSLRRAKNRRALAGCAPFWRSVIATGGSGGNTIGAISVLGLTETRLTRNRDQLPKPILQNLTSTTPDRRGRVKVAMDHPGCVLTG